MVAVAILAAGRGTVFTQAEALCVMAEETAKGWRNPNLMQQFTEFMRSTILIT